MSEWNLPNWFGFGAYQAKLFFKLPLPKIDIDLAIVKDNPIICSPIYLKGSHRFEIGSDEVCYHRSLSLSMWKITSERVLDLTVVNFL